MSEDEGVLFVDQRVADFKNVEEVKVTGMGCGRYVVREREESKMMPRLWADEPRVK